MFFFYHTQTKICWRQHFLHLSPKFPEFYFIFLIFVKIIPWRRKFVLGFLTLIRTFCHMFSDHTQFRNWWRQQFRHLSEYCFELRFVQKISHSFGVALFFFFELISISLLLFWFLYNSIIIPVIMLKVKNAK